MQKLCCPVWPGIHTLAVIALGKGINDSGWTAWHRGMVLVRCCPESQSSGCWATVGLRFVHRHGFGLVVLASPHDGKDINFGRSTGWSVYAVSRG